jgi:hypothetical protein
MPIAAQKATAGSRSFQMYNKVSFSFGVSDIFFLLDFVKNQFHTMYHTRPMFLLREVQTQGDYEQ